LDELAAAAQRGVERRKACLAASLPIQNRSGMTVQTRHGK
jgi:hypothetical protein